MSYIATEDTKEWFDDLISMIDSLSSLSIFAHREFEKSIAEQAAEVRKQMETIFYNKGKGNVGLVMKSLDDPEQEIKNASIRDLELE